jgi:hypothetical protein
MYGFGMLEFIAIAMLVLFILVPFVLFIWALADILKSEFKDKKHETSSFHRRNTGEQGDCLQGSEYQPLYLYSYREIDANHVGGNSHL